MTHILMSHFDDGRLAMARPIIAKDEEELNSKVEAFKVSSIDESIGDQVSFITEEEFILLQNLDVDEVYDSGE